MRSNEEIYGIEGAKQLTPIPPELIQQRIDILTTRLTGLLKVHYFQRDFKLVTEVDNSIKFWESINVK